MVTFTIGLELELKTETSERIKALGEETGAFLAQGAFTLASGDKSSYYFDGKKITLSGEGAYRVAEAILELLADTKFDAIGGLTIGADPIATAVALVSYLKGKPVPAFIVRTEPKKHGTQQLIEGHLPKGGRIVIVDDVITKGNSVLRAIKAVEAEGCKVVKVVTILDRREGGSDELRKQGYDFATILSYSLSGGAIIEQ